LNRAYAAVRQTASEASGGVSEAEDTSPVTVDLDKVAQKIARLQSYCDEHGFACRPHVKTHKIPEIDAAQFEAGVVGITCQKLGGAEVMVAAGVRDVLITFPLVGGSKTHRLASLAASARVDGAGGLRGLRTRPLRHARSGRCNVEVLVGCDTGFGRTGVQTPAAAAQLVELVASLPGLRFAGLMAYPTMPESGPWLQAARTGIEERGLKVECVSSGGTATAFRTHEIGEIPDIRCGTYVYGDRACIANGTNTVDDCALRVRATVVSRPTRDRAILDAGSKTLTSDPVEANTGFGLVLEHPEVELYVLHEEHGHLDVAACPDPPDVGDVPTIVPNHACGCANLHDEVAVHRGGQPAGTLRVAARGRIR
jgi:D-serine deaminase-like pyridoxal phosphate-dependent protein